MRGRLAVVLGVVAVGMMVGAPPVAAGPPSAPTLQVTKTGPEITAAKSVIFYDVTVTNPGPDPVLNAMVLDQLGAGTDDGFIQVTSDAPWGCNPDLMTLQVTCTAASVPPGSTHVSIGIMVRDDVTVGAVVTNMVQVSATDVEPVSAQSSATVIGGSTIAVDADGPAYTQAPGTVTYHVVLRNTGAVPVLYPNLIVDIPDPLFPVTPQVAPPGWDCNFTPSAVYSCIGVYQLDAGASADFDLSFTVADGTAPGTQLPLVFRGAAINAARVETPVTTTVVGPTTLSLGKRAPGEVTSGRVLRYELEIANTGSSVAVQPSVHDLLPAGLVPTAIDIEFPWSCDRSDAEVTCTADALAPGAGAHIGVRARVEAPPGTVLHNRADASATNADEVSAAADTTVVASAAVPPRRPVAPPPGPVREIAFTGAPTRPLVVAGVGLLILGLALLALARWAGAYRPARRG